MATITTSRLNRLPAAERGITIGDFLVPIEVGERISVRARHLGLVLLGVAFIALTAQFSIHLPDSPVPITGQTLGVLLVGGALGFRRGALATFLYLAVAVIGVPAFAEGKSGIGVIASMQDGRLVLGATGGYLVGFLIASAVVGRLAELGWDRRIAGAVAAMAIGNVIIYIVGVPWIAASVGYSLGEAVSKGLVPFLLGDALKLLIAGGLFPMAWWIVGRRDAER
ncbi:MAG: biotin transporter BioY [Chloroflexi bacterium]|nr:biotin transporter BioY [Chloroflexota bacterium]